jgi:uncharacterized protein YeaO (DUF488 family)
MTTPPEKYTVTSKRETVKPRELTAKEAKYNSDVEAGERYKSEQASYEKKSKAYNEDKKMTAGRRLYSEFGGGAVDLSPEGLKRYNIRENERTGLNATRIQRPKDSGSEDEYLSRLEKKGGFIGHVDYEKPVAPKKPSTPNERDMPMGRLPMNKITGVKSTTKGNFKKKDISAPEKAAFANPPKPRSYKSERSTLRNDHRLLGVDYTAKVRTNLNTGRKKLYVEDVKLARKIAPKGYNKEEKRFKAFAGTTATGDRLSSMSSKDIKKYKQEAKSIRAEYRKQPDSDVKSMGKAAMTSEIRQSRKAQAFAKAAEKGKNKFFTDKNYKGPIVRDYRESKDNAVIRDNMDAKLKAIGAKESKRLSELEASKKGGFQYNNFSQQ